MDVKARFLEEPGNLDRLIQVETEYATGEQWESLLECYRLFLENSEDEDIQNRYYLKQALIYDELLTNPGKAIEQLLLLLQRESFNFDHFKYFEALCQESGETNKLIESYQAVLPKVDDEFQLQLNYKLGELFYQQKDYHQAVISLDQALVIDETHHDSEMLLERILSQEDLPATAIASISDIYRRLENWEQLLYCYRSRVKRFSEIPKEEHYATLLEKVELLESYFPDREEEILKSLIKAYKIEQDTDTLFEKIEYYTENLGTHKAVIKHLVEISKTSVLQDFLNYKVGTIYYTILDDRGRALEYLLAYSQGAEHYYETGFSYLVELLESQEDYAQLVQALLKQSSFLEDIQMQIDLFQRAATLYEEQLDQPEAAIKLYQKMVVAFPDEVGYQQALGRLYERVEQWGLLLETMDTLKELNEDPVVCDRKRAEVYDYRLKQASEAIDAYRNILSLYGYDDHDDVVARLRELYRQEERFVELKAFLEEYKSFVYDEEKGEKIDFEIAQVDADKFENYTESLARLSGLLEMNPQHQESIELLMGLLQKQILVEEIYNYLNNLFDSTDQIDHWIKLNQVKIKISEDREEQATLCKKVGYIFIERSGDPERAYDYFAKALLLMPVEENYTPYKEYLDSMDNWEQGVTDLKTVSEKLDPELDLVSVLNFDLGHYLFEQGKQQDAVTYLERVIAQNDHHLEALQELDELYRDLSKHEALYRILQLKLKADPQSDTLYRLKDLALGRFDLKEDAIAFLYQLYDIDEYSREQHRSDLITHLSELSRWEELGTFYRRVLDEDQSPEMMEAAADHYYTHMKAYDQAAELYQEILDFTENRLKVLNHLEVIYEDQEHDEALVETLELKFEYLKEMGDKDGVIVLIFKLARLYLEKVLQYEKGTRMLAYLVKANYNPKEVIDYLEPLIAQEVLLPYIAEALDQLYRQEKMWRQLITLYNSQLPLMIEDDQINLISQIAIIYRDELQEAESALAYFDRAFRMTLDQDTLGEIATIIDQIKGYEQQATLYQSYLDELEFSDIEQQIEIGLALGDTYFNRLSNQQKGIDTLVRIYELDENNLTVLNRLIEFELGTELYDSVQTRYFRKLELVDGEEQIDLKLEISRFLVKYFQNFAQSIELLKEILEWDSNEERAIKFLMKLNQSFKIDALSYKHDVLNVLKPVYLDRGEYDQLAILFESIIMLSGIEENEKIEMIQEEVGVFFEVGEYERGIEKYEQWLTETKLNLTLLSKGLEYGEMSGDYDALLAVYKKLVSLGKQTGNILDLYLLMGEINFKYLNASGEAENYFNAILKSDATHLGALNKLEIMYEEYGEHEKLKGVYHQIIDVVAHDQERLFDVYHKLGILLNDNLYEPHEAVTYYEKARELKPGYESILNKLFDYYKSVQDFGKILPVVEGFLVAHPEDPTFLNRAVYFYLKQYKEVSDSMLLERSVALAESSYQLDSTNEKTQVLLMEAYKDKGDFQKMVTFYQNRLSQSDDVDEKVEINLHLASIYINQLNDIDGALTCVEFVVTEDPYNEKILDVKEKIYEVQEDWANLVELYDQKISYLSEEQIGAVRFRKVQILSEKLNQYDEALEILKELIYDMPENRTYLFYAEDVFTAQGNLKGFFDFIKAQVPEVEAKDLKAAILVKMGNIAYQSFKKEGLALKCYDKALDFVEHEAGALTGKKEIARNQGDYNLFAELLLIEFTACSDETKREQLKNELIDIYINQLKQPGKVIPFKEEAYQKDPENEEAMIALIELYPQGDESYAFFDYVDPFFDKIKGDRKMENRHIHMYHLGLAAQKFGDTDRAKVCYETTNRLKMGYIPNQMALGSLLMDTGDTAGALKAFQLLQLNQSKIDDQQMKLELFLRLARLRAAGNDQLRAKSMYKKVLEIDPDHAEAKAFLG